MEVHHHPQLEHKPKPWKEYLLEGLMIFIAVTLGFFAESLREHIAKKDNEQQVIASLVRSIKKDTAFLSNLVNVYIPAHNRWTDSVNKDFDSLGLKGNERRITLAIMNATTWNTYAPPEMALNLVKDAGAFDVAGKEKAKDRLLSFSARTTGFIKYSEFLTAVEHQLDTAGESFLPRKNERVLLVRLYGASDNNNFLTIADIPADVKFKTYNKAVFLAYMRKLDQIDFLLNDMLGDYKGLLGEETMLLTVLKEQYNLKDE